VIAGGFGGHVASEPALGWRFAFTVCGAFGMLYAGPLVVLLRDATKSKSLSQKGRIREGEAPAEPVFARLTARQERHPPTSKTDSEERETSKASPLLAAQQLFANRSFVLLVLYFTLPALAGWIVRDWMPSILKKQFDIGQGEAGVAATVYWQIAAIVGAVAGGWLADRWMRRSQRGRIVASALGMSLIAPAIFGMGSAGSLTVAVGFLILFGVGWGFFDTNNMPILSQIVSPELRATGYGVMNFVSISCGGLADWGFGALRDRQVPIDAIFSVFASLAIVSVILVLLIKPRNDLSAQN
jgi:MFS family permease